MVHVLFLVVVASSLNERQDSGRIVDGRAIFSLVVKDADPDQLVDRTRYVEVYLDWRPDTRFEAAPHHDAQNQEVYA